MTFRPDAGLYTVTASSEGGDMAESALQEEFLPLAEPYRRELLAHCYRMLGSVHDAEDLVQETYLRAWRGFDGFEGRSSIRTWLYRIATSACLTALETRNRRPLPSGLGTPKADPDATLVQQNEVLWLEPIPDAMVAAEANDPATIVTSRESIRLAMVAALQHLPPKQRAVLILCEVMKWKAAEVAELLDTTTAAVNSALQRARAQLDEAAPSRETVSEPLTAEQGALLDRYVEAFESYDVKALVTLFSDDAVWEMPPYTGWYQSPEAIGTLVANQCPAKRAGDLKLVATTANGQAAFGMYLRGADQYDAFQLHVVDLGSDGIDHVVAFFDLRLFATFGLPDTLPLADA
jgi:RNA polymerase sigma-70 factor (ECF subfamily)